MTDETKRRMMKHFGSVAFICAVFLLTGFNVWCNVLYTKNYEKVRKAVGKMPVNFRVTSTLTRAGLTVKTPDATIVWGNNRWEQVVVIKSDQGVFIIRRQGFLGRFCGPDPQYDGCAKIGVFDSILGRLSSEQYLFHSLERAHYYVRHGKKLPERAREDIFSSVTQELCNIVGPKE